MTGTKHSFDQKCNLQQAKQQASHNMLCAILQSPVWRLSWSITGGTLAVSDSQGSVTLWKEGLDGQWQQLSA